MNDRDRIRKDLKDWKRLKRALFKAPAVEPSEAFVRRVMAALPQETAEAAWTFVDWLTPALGFAFASLLLFYARPRVDREPFPDSVMQAATVADLQARGTPILSGTDGGLAEYE